MKSIILSITLFSSVLSGSPLSHNSIYNQIIKNKPTINRDYAKKLSVIILEETKKVNIDPRLFTAMLMQESSYVSSARNCKTVEEGYEVCTDYSIAQIHYKTVKLYGFDKELLMSDVRYGVKAGLRVLSDFKKRYGYKEETYWSRYNASKPSLRKKYKERVERYL